MLRAWGGAHAGLLSRPVPRFPLSVVLTPWASPQRLKLIPEGLQQPGLPESLPAQPWGTPTEG